MLKLEFGLAACCLQQNLSDGSLRHAVGCDQRTRIAMDLNGGLNVLCCEPVVELAEDPGKFQKNPPPIPPRINLAEALGRAGQPEEARRVIEPALEGLPGPSLKMAWTVYRKASMALGDTAGIRRADEALARLGSR